MSGFGGMLFGADLFGAGQAPSGPATPEIANVNPANSPSGLPISTSLAFDLLAANNIEAVGVAVQYRSTAEYFMAYELDEFTAVYAPVSSVGGIGTTAVSFTLFEFDGWRDRVRSIVVFGIDSAAQKFVLEVLEA